MQGKHSPFKKPCLEIPIWFNFGIITVIIDIVIIYAALMPQHGQPIKHVELSDGFVMHMCLHAATC